MKKLLAVLVTVGGCFAATPPQNVPVARTVWDLFSFLHGSTNLYYFAWFSWFFRFF